MATAKLEVAREFLELLWVGQIDKALEMTTADFEFRSAFDQTMDRAGLASTFKGSMGMLAGPFHSNVVGATVEKNRVAVEMTGHVLLTNGREYSNRYHMLFEVQGTQIKAWREYCDTKATEVFMMPPIEQQRPPAQA